MNHERHEYHGLIEVWSGLRDSPYSLYLIHYTVDSVGQPVLDPGAQIAVAYERTRGLIVFGFHEYGPLSDAWEMTSIVCGELHETLASPALAVRPMLVSTSVHGFSREASFVPPLSFVGANERVSEDRLDALLGTNTVPHPFVLEGLADAYVLVEPYAPVGLVECDDQTSKYTLFVMGA